MKKIFTFLAAAALLFGISSCITDECKDCNPIQKTAIERIQGFWTLARTTDAAGTEQEPNFVGENTKEGIYAEKELIYSGFIKDQIFTPNQMLEIDKEKNQDPAEIKTIDQIGPGGSTYERLYFVKDQLVLEYHVFKTPETDQISSINYYDKTENITLEK